MRPPDLFGDAGAQPHVRPDSEALARRLEAHVTDPRATPALLAAELFTSVVWDPCCGTGMIAGALARAGYAVIATDIHDWGYAGADDRGLDFLSADRLLAPSIVMNPPFSLAAAFVEHALGLGARKVASFQRWAWWEGHERVHGFWRRHPPNRIYGFDRRVRCRRFDLTEEEVTNDPPTMHAWFVWEPGHPPGTLAGHLSVPARRAA